MIKFAGGDIPKGPVHPTSGSAGLSSGPSTRNHNSLNSTAYAPNPPTTGISKLIKDNFVEAVIGALLTFAFASTAQWYDNGLLARVIGATPKWRSVDLKDGTCFDPYCEYRFQVPNMEIEQVIPDVLGVGDPMQFYPLLINRNGKVASYDTVTMSISYKAKNEVHVKFRTMNHWMPTGEIGGRQWVVAEIQSRCPWLHSWIAIVRLRNCVPHKSRILQLSLAVKM